jgi:hypothetical protein
MDGKLKSKESELLVEKFKTNLHEAEASNNYAPKRFIIAEISRNKIISVL